MWWRLSLILTSLLGTGTAVTYFKDLSHGLLAVLVLAAAWLLLDLWRAARLLRWLRACNLADSRARGAEGDAEAGSATLPPPPRGLGSLWGEMADRTRRLLRHREQRVRDSQHRLQEFLAAIQASPNGVVLLDAQDRIEWCNQTAAEHFGIDAHRDLLQQVGNLVRDPAFTAYMNAQRPALELVMAGPQGTVSRPVKISVQLHAYGEGRRLLLSRDITALEQAEAMRRDFVANVSHEIRTPLTVLNGFIETLQSLPLDADERQRYLGLMAQQGGRLQSLVNDLLTLSRLEGSPLPGLQEWTPVASLFAQCAEEAQALSAVLTRRPDGGHRLSFPSGALPGSSPLGEFAGSGRELQSALSNLVSNAVRYTPAGGQVRVDWQALPDGRAELSVSDTGPGIAPEHLNRLTERFYRVDRSRSRETGGTGLGLAIVKHVVQRHGGELRIQSTPGQGSRFAMVLPANRWRPPRG